MGVEVLVIDEIVVPRDCIPLEDVGHEVVKPVGIHETGIRGRYPVLERNELERVALEHEIVLDSDIQVTSLVEHVQRPVPLVVGQ